MGEYKAPKGPFCAAREARILLFLGKYRISAAGTQRIRAAILMNRPNY